MSIALTRLVETKQLNSTEEQRRFGGVREAAREGLGFGKGGVGGIACFFGRGMAERVGECIGDGH